MTLSTEVDFCWLTPDEWIAAPCMACADRFFCCRGSNLSGNSALAQLIYFGLPRYAIQGGLKNWHTFLYALTSSNIDRFSNLFHCHNQENICNNTATLHNTIPQVWLYTTLWNVSVLKATIESKTTSVTTHFKSASSSSKADTLNIWCKNCRIRQLL